MTPKSKEKDRSPLQTRPIPPTPASGRAGHQHEAAEAVPVGLGAWPFHVEGSRVGPPFRTREGFGTPGSHGKRQPGCEIWEAPWHPP